MLPWNYLAYPEVEVSHFLPNAQFQMKRQPNSMKQLHLQMQYKRHFPLKLTHIVTNKGRILMIRYRKEEKVRKITW